MARYEIAIAYPGSTLNTSTGSMSLPFRKYVQQVRDSFREELLGSSAVVSDICMWQSYDANTYTAAFVVKQGLDEWLFPFYHAASVLLGRHWGSQSSTTLNKYFISRTGSNVSASSAGDNQPIVIYNCRKGSFGMGFNDPVALTYTNGDFSAPAYSPYTAMDQFMPTGMLRSVVDNLTHTTSYSDYSVLQFIYDDTHRALFYVSSDTGSPRPTTLWMSGQLLTELNAGDSDRTFTGALSLNASGAHSNTVALVYDMNGLPHSCNLNFVDSFTLDNYLLPNGTVDFNSVLVMSNTYTKGIFHTDLVRVQGPANTVLGYGGLYDSPSGPLVRYTAYLAIMYKQNIPAYPYDIGYDSRSFFT